MAELTSWAGTGQKQRQSSSIGDICASWKQEGFFLLWGLPLFCSSPQLSPLSWVTQTCLSKQTGWIFYVPAEYLLISFRFHLKTAQQPHQVIGRHFVWLEDRLRAGPWCIPLDGYSKMPQIGWCKPQKKIYFFPPFWGRKSKIKVLFSLMTEADPASLDSHGSLPVCIQSPERFSGIFFSSYKNTVSTKDFIVLQLPPQRLCCQICLRWGLPWACRRNVILSWSGPSCAFTPKVSCNFKETVTNLIDRR